MSDPRVAAIVLNYNGKEITLQTVESLLRMDYPSFDVVVIDNGSTDGSYDAVAEQYPQALQVRKEKNEGPVRGINLGIGFALERDYDYLLILNNDIEVAPTLLSEMVRLADGDPTVGCVGPKSYYYDDRQRLWSAGGIIRFKESATRERGMGQLDRGQYDRDQEVDYINGCAMLVPQKVMREVGLWDPVYYLSVDDADWCMRMKSAGYRSLYAHRAILWHMVSQTVGVYTPSKTFQNGRSTAIFMRRHAGPWQWLTYLLFTAMALPAAFLRELPKGNQAAVAAKLRGMIDGLRAPLTDPPPYESGNGGLPNDNSALKDKT